MNIYLASDHAGVALKAKILEAIPGAIDMGASEVAPEDDYPAIIRPCAEKVAGEEGSFGIVLGGSGHGEAMVANRVPGVRCATFYGPVIPQEGGDMFDIVRVSRMHNDANMLSIGARFVSEDDALRAVRIFLETPFSRDERHIRRIASF